MPNVPLARELEALADTFHAALQSPPADISGPRPTPVDAPEEMFSNVDTRIFARARPVLPHESAPATVVRRIEGMRNCIFMSPELTVSRKASVVPTSIPVDATFTDLDSNEMVYQTTCKSLLPIAAGGGSAALLCYGQTGSGKTYTTTGVLRCLARDIQALLSPGLAVKVSFLEVHADGCRDLISGEDQVMVLEDKQGAVQVHNAQETVVRSGDDVTRLTDAAIAARSTKSTGRNQSGSSRSHMAVRFVFQHVDTPWVAPGVLNVIDLAGSESAADAAGHDKERINETKFINSSLMTLKECIRARGQAAVTMKHVHIPFRQSKLTLLLRDSFELVVSRQTKTAMIACVSPLLRDSRHTYNTLRYAALLYVSPKANVVVSRDERDPNSWDRGAALEFIVKSSNGRIKNPEAILPAGDGRALAQLPETDFINRATSSCGLGPKAAKEIYSKVWKAVIDAKKILRGNIQRAKVDAAAKRGESAALEKLAAKAARDEQRATAPRDAATSSSEQAAPRPMRRAAPAAATDVVSCEELPRADPPHPADRHAPHHRHHRPHHHHGHHHHHATHAADSGLPVDHDEGQRVKVVGQPRHVPAELVEEKENDAYLQDLNQRMMFGFVGGAAGGAPKPAPRRRPAMPE